jgi:hypothetical protein
MMAGGVIPVARLEARRGLPLWATLSMLPVLLLALLPFGGSPAWAGAPTHHGNASGPTGWSSRPSKFEFPLRTSSPSLRPDAGSIDVYSLYAHEPAPMGLTDYGVGPNGIGYTYSTDGFRGIAHILSLSARNASLPPSDANNVSLQLNVFLTFRSGASDFLFWVQDVAELNTSANTVWFGNNLWNMTGGSVGTVLSSTVTGNGTIQGGAGISVYVDYANHTLPGDFVNLSYPNDVGLEVDETVVNGTPSLTFKYDDRGAWTTYDVVRFPFTKAVGNASFVVDGRQYLLISGQDAFEDAELILGGAFGGETNVINAAELSTSLFFDNGHNWQRVPNAFDFGSDTAELVAGVTDSLATNASNGNLTGALGARSGGTLHGLYNRSYAAILNATVPFASGAIEVNGTEEGPFTGSSFNLTLAPGTYEVRAVPATGPSVSASVTLAPGEYRAVALAYPSTWNVTFLSKGLPALAPWSVDLNGSQQNTTSSTLVFSETNGTYPYTVGVPAGFVASPLRGSVPVNGSDVTVLLTFTPVVYKVTIAEQGLPSGTLWSATVGSAIRYSTGVSIEIPEPNGNYSFTIGAVQGFRADPSSGSLTVNGGATSVAIVFTMQTYPLWFNDTWTGAVPLRTGTISSWTVIVNGTGAFGGSVSNASTIDRSLGFLEPAGFTGTYVVLPPEGFQVDPAMGTVSIPDPGGPVTEVIDLALLPPPSVVSFEATPSTLTLGASVSLSVLAEGGVGPLTYAFSGLPEGCQSQNATNLTCTPSEAGRSVVTVVVTDVLGQAATANATIVVGPKGPPPSPVHPAPPTFLRLPVFEGYAVLGALLATIAVLADLAIVLRRRGRTSRTPSKRRPGPKRPPLLDPY